MAHLYGAARSAGPATAATATAATTTATLGDQVWLGHPFYNDKKYFKYVSFIETILRRCD